MFKIKSKHIKTYQKKSKSDHFFWFLENYLPQKKSMAERQEFSLGKLGVDTINQILKFASILSKSLKPISSNTKVSFTLGSWALPYLKLLKQIGSFK